MAHRKTCPQSGPRSATCENFGAARWRTPSAPRGGHVKTVLPQVHPRNMSVLRFATSPKWHIVKLGRKVVPATRLVKISARHAREHLARHAVVMSRRCCRKCTRGTCQFCVLPLPQDGTSLNYRENGASQRDL